MPDCFDVSSYFLFRAAQEKKPLTNLKLQKLMYYAQGFYLALNDETLFSNSIEAWDHGPVVPDTYHRYKQYKNSAIPLDDEFDASQVFNSPQILFLNSIYESFSRFGAWTLRQMTHKERPWLNHSADGETADSDVISIEEIKDHFKQFVTTNDYIQSYIELSKIDLETEIVALPKSINSSEKFIDWIRNQNK